MGRDLYAGEGLKGEDAMAPKARLVMIWNYDGSITWKIGMSADKPTTKDVLQAAAKAIKMMLTPQGELERKEEEGEG